MILITGAAGKTGQAVIRAATARGQPVRALVRRTGQSQALKGMGAQEVVTGDMRDQEAMDGALQGVRAVYHICPNVSPDEVTIAQIVISAAISAGAQHFVYHSVLHPQTEAMPHHWLKLRAEEKLLESGLPYTILQPAAYMQNVLAHWDQIVQEGIYPVPYPAETRLGMVDLGDVAQAAARVLTETGHSGATYEMAGPEVLSQIEIASLLEQRLGRPVRTQCISLGSWESQARFAGLNDYQVEALLKMFGYYERHGFWGNANVLNWLLGRPATGFAAFVDRTIRERAGA